MGKIIPIILPGPESLRDKEARVTYGIPFKLLSFEKRAVIKAKIFAYHYGGSNLKSIIKSK